MAALLLLLLLLEALAELEAVAPLLEAAGAAGAGALLLDALAELAAWINAAAVACLQLLMLSQVPCMSSCCI